MDSVKGRKSSYCTIEYFLFQMTYFALVFGYKEFTSATALSGSPTIRICSKSISTRSRALEVLEMNF